MNVNALIDALVRQTSVLVAQLATQQGARAQLAHTANQVFLDLVAALKEQGLGSRVIADMFGLALRTYHERVRRLSESRSVRGRSLWEAVLEFVEQGPRQRAEVLGRFSYDDPDNVRGVLRDLVHSGLLHRTGRGDATSYGATSDEQRRSHADSSEESQANLVWITVYRKSPISRSALLSELALGGSALDAALETLVQRGLVTRLPNDAPPSEQLYSSDGCVLPYEDPSGWEAAVFDHYQALVGAISAKLRAGRNRARASDLIGGSTFGFEVWPEHPEYATVRGLLSRYRNECTQLRARVAEYNTHHPAPENTQRIVTYFGQNVLGSDEPEDQDDCQDDD